jgi:hypothetical protein
MAQGGNLTLNPSPLLWVQTATATLAALAGVLIGGWITSRNQKKERQHRRMREQLEGFYSVLLALRMQIRAKSHLRERLRTIANDAWQEELKPAGDDPQAKARIEDIRWPQYEKIFEYDERQLHEEILPLYGKMLDHMTTHMGLAERSTLSHYEVLVEFLEIWNRGLQKTLPPKLISRIGHEEANLHPFYEELETQTERLRAQLKK